MMDVCEVPDCGREINRDGLCFKHKIQHVRFGIEGIARERKGKGPGLTGEEGTREYVRQMYEQRRKDGLPDPIPENSKAAAFAPAEGPIKTKRQEKFR